MKPGTLFIVSAPSGAGKTSLVNAVLERIAISCPLERVITYTTKVPREHEVQGKDYHFVSHDDFKQKIAEGFFIEHSTAYGCYYGSPRTILEGLASGTSYIMVVDRDGAKAICKHIKQAVLIWIYTPSFSVLQQRLAGRGTENKQQQQKRLMIAKAELEQERTRQLYHHHICNDQFDRAVDELMQLIYRYQT